MQLIPGQHLKLCMEWQVGSRQAILHDRIRAARAVKLGLIPFRVVVGCIVDLVIVFIVPCRLVRCYVFYLILECHLISVRNGLSLGHQGVGVGMAWGRVTRQSGKQGQAPLWAELSLPPQLITPKRGIIMYKC